MKISNVNSRVPVENQIEVALLQKSQQIAKQQGNEALKLIEAAGQGTFENNPLPSGPVGTKINIAA